MSKFNGKFGEKIQIKTEDGRNFIIIVNRIDDDDGDNITVEVLDDERSDSEEITIKLKKNEDYKKLTIKIVRHEDNDSERLSDGETVMVSGNESQCNDKLSAEVKQEHVRLQNGQLECATTLAGKQLPVISKNVKEASKIDRPCINLEENPLPVNTADAITKIEKNRNQYSLRCRTEKKRESKPKQRKGTSSTERVKKYRQKIRNDPELRAAHALKVKQQNTDCRARLKARRRIDKCLDEKCKLKQKQYTNKWRLKTYEKFLAEVKQEPVDLQDGLSESQTVLGSELCIASMSANQGGSFEEGNHAPETEKSTFSPIQTVNGKQLIPVTADLMDELNSFTSEENLWPINTAEAITKIIKNKNQHSLTCDNDKDRILFPERQNGSSSAERVRKYRQKIRNNPELHAAHVLKIKQQNKECRERLKERRKADTSLDEKCKLKERQRKDKWRQKTSRKLLKKSSIKLPNDPSPSMEYQPFLGDEMREPANSVEDSEGFIHGRDVINSLNDESKQRLVTYEAIEDIGDIEEISEEDLKYFITVNPHSPDS